VDFVNQSGLVAGWTTGFERDGRELLVVVVKGTYSIPVGSEEPFLTEQQVELVKGDEFSGEPGHSAPLRESDYAHRKPKCDVVLNGSAYASGEQPTTAVEVSLGVGRMYKSFFVFGDRRWDGAGFSVFPTEPEPFLQTAISYNSAYGGTDLNEEQPGKIETYVQNPIGTGYHPIRRRSALVGRSLPNTAEGESPISETSGNYRPMSLGPIGRNFFPRFRHAGTYDQNWLDNEAPFWPADFSYAYFQCAPEDQQVSHLQGGEEVEMKNLTPDGWRSFRIPKRTIPVTFIPYQGDDLQTEALCDTFLLEPDLNRFSLTWRAALPMRRSIFEVKQTIVGDMPRSWYSKRRAQRAGKAYYASLADAVAARGGRRRKP
jgi:hypothetical protein